MAYDLCFTPEFFFIDGEPYDGLSDTERPCSVWSAIEGMRLHNYARWCELAADVFKCHGRYLTAETVLDKVRETNTCSNLSNPVQVWIDPEGDYTITVWEK